MFSPKAGRCCTGKKLPSKRSGRCTYQFVFSAVVFKRKSRNVTPNSRTVYSNCIPPTFLSCVCVCAFFALCFVLFSNNYFRCGWSKSNLCVALESLLSACATHREAFRVPNFGGLDVVFRNDPSVLDNGECEHRNSMLCLASKGAALNFLSYDTRRGLYPSSIWSFTRG